MVVFSQVCRSLVTYFLPFYLGYLSISHLTPLPIPSGLNGPRHTLLEYETSLIQLQLSMESTFIDMAALMSKESSQPSVILCDRGACDVAAYVPPDLWKDILERLGVDHAQLMDRYDLVCHLVTAANGAESHYTLTNNNTRTETPEEARMLDLKTQLCWDGHPQRRVFPNRPGSTFQDKLNETTAYVLEQCQRIRESGGNGGV